MDDLPREWANRLSLPSWRDARLLVGLVLILASVALGSTVVAAADDTAPVYAATHTLPGGHALGPGDLTVVRVRLEQGVAAYLPATAAAPAGAVILRTVERGELVPISALGAAAALTRRPVSVPVEAPVPAGLRPGALVDLWTSARDTSSAATGTMAFLEPRRLVSAAEVHDVSAEGSGITSARGVAVQVMLEEPELIATLDALANGGRLTVIPSVGGSGGAG